MLRKALRGVKGGPGGLAGRRDPGRPRTHIGLARITKMCENPLMLDAPRFPLRIIHVMNALGIAGMEVGVAKLVNRQDPARFAPLLCCLEFASDDARGLVDPKIPIVVLGKRTGIDPTIVSKLVRLFRRERPHIVHSHNWATFLYTVVAAKLTRVPVLIHGEHGYEDHRAVMRRLMEPMSVMDKVRNFVYVVIDHRRGPDFASIVDAFETLLDERLGFVAAEVRSATPLTDDAPHHRVLSSRAPAHRALERTP